MGWQLRRDDIQSTESFLFALRQDDENDPHLSGKRFTAWADPRDQAESIVNALEKDDARPERTKQPIAKGESKRRRNQK